MIESLAVVSAQYDCWISFCHPYCRITEMDIFLTYFLFIISLLVTALVVICSISVGHFYFSSTNATDSHIQSVTQTTFLWKWRKVHVELLPCLSLEALIPVLPMLQLWSLLFDMRGSTRYLWLSAAAMFTGVPLLRRSFQASYF